MCEDAYVCECEWRDCDRGRKPELRETMQEGVGRLFMRLRRA